MSQPVKLSDALVLDARLAAEVQERSIAGQIEYWAKLGKAVEHLLKVPQVQALRRNAELQPLSERLTSVDSPEGRARVEAYLETRPYPHYEEGGRPGVLLKVDEDGTKTLGRFVNRVFVSINEQEGDAPAAVRTKTRKPARVSKRTKALKTNAGGERKTSAKVVTA
jgi:hypothetical protein